MLIPNSSEKNQITVSESPLFMGGYRRYLLIRVSGIWGIGSNGNENGKILAEYIKDSLIRNNPKNIIIDFSSLNYEWGDAILAFAAILCRRGDIYNLATVSQGKAFDLLNTLRAWSGEGLQYFGNFSTLEAAAEIMESC